MNREVNLLTLGKWLGCSLLIVLVGCQSDPQKESIAPLAPTYKAEIVRYDKLIRAIDVTAVAEGVEKIMTDYPAFSEVYFQNVIGVGRDTDVVAAAEALLRDTSFIKLMDETIRIYPDMEDIHPRISQALENYALLFGIPQAQLPSVYTFISGFAYQSFVFDDGGKDGVGVGLDMFLGDEFPYETVDPSDPAFSSYITRAYNKDHMTMKIAEVLVEDQLGPPSGADFLSLILWGGKKLYMLDQILDFVPDTVITEYSASQLAWCRNNEAEMWQFFFDKDLFYSTNTALYQKLITQAPTSPGMPEASPGRTGNYMGWQIINAYMQRYPDTQLQELIMMRDAQRLLDESRYRPG